MRLLRRPELSAAVRIACRLHLRTCGPLLFTAILILSAPAQGPATGVLHGVVTDDSERRLLHTRITARNDETGVEFSGEALRDGSFTLAGLPPGSYSLRVDGRIIRNPQAATVTVAPGETVEIAALLGPNRHTLVDLALGLPDGPGGEPDENADGLLGSRGLQATQNASTLDGADSSQSYNAAPAGSGNEGSTDPDDDPDSAERGTGPTHGFAAGRHAGLSSGYAQGAVQEFRVGTNGYSAQTGSPGSLHAAISRAGGERLHGALLFDLRSSALAARNPLAIATSYRDGVITSQNVKPHDLRETAALALGGPLPRLRRLFFFYAFDETRRGFPAISSPVDPNFYALTPIQRALLATRGVSSAAINTQLNYLSSLTGEVPRRSDQTLHFGRLDWRPLPALGASLAYNRARWNAPAGLIEAPTIARGRASIGTSLGSVDHVLLRLAPRLSSRMQADFHIAYARDLHYELPQLPLPQEPAIAPGGFAPEVNVGPNGILFGTPASVSRQAYPNEQRLEAGVALSLLKGHHLLQLGGAVTRAAEQVATLANAAGTFHYDSGVTRGRAGGLVDFITDAAFNVNAYPNGGCPSISAADHLFCFRSYTQSFGEEQVRFATTAWTAFVEDSWRPEPRLTLHAGLRYEYTLLPLPQRPNPALDALFGAFASTSIFPEDRNNLGPRLSAAFEPLGRGAGTVRLGYGVFFGHLPGATLKAALADTGQPAATTRIRIAPSAVTACPQVPAQGFGYPCSFLAAPTGVAAQTTSSVAFDRHFRLPVVQQASVAFERQVHGNTAVSVGLVINADRQLPGSTDLNIAPSTGLALVQLQGGNGQPGVRDGETFVVPRYTARLTPSFGPVTDIVSHANAYYDGLILRLTTRPAPGFRLQAHYTWSKAIDFGQSASATPRTNGQFDPFADGYDKGLSSLNYPHALHATLTWHPPESAANFLPRAVASGWSLAAIATARSGRPYSYDLSGGTSLPGGHLSLNGSGGALYLPTVGRNTLRLPPTIKTDLHLSRSFAVRHTLHGEATADAFNVFNHRSLSSVNQRAFLVGTEVNGVTPIVFQDAATIAAEGLNVTPFATPTASGSNTTRERQIQLALRLTF